MKIRIKFSKTGHLKYIGHLDIMRCFQKIMRRAEVDIAYSAGFSPHQIMSFASPLGLGLTSEGEYVDIEVLSTQSSEVMLKKINAVAVDGLQVLSYVRLPDQAKTAMSMVAAADYRVSFNHPVSPRVKEQFEDFLSRDSPFSIRVELRFRGTLSVLFVDSLRGSEGRGRSAVTGIQIGNELGGNPVQRAEVFVGGAG